MSKSKIEWTERTIQFTGGCSKVSDGCRNCYAIPFVNRLASNPKVKTDYSGLVHKINNGLNWTNEIRLFPENLDIPLNVKKPTLWFVDSMSDLFHEKVPFEFIEKVYTTIYEADWHTFQILTKRPERALEFYSKSMWLLNDSPKNIWFGVSISTNDDLWMVEKLLQIPAAVRFVSYEPALGLVDFGNLIKEIDLLIAGAESGPKARPCHPDWIRSARDQCVEADTCFFFKQWGEWMPVAPEESTHWIQADGLWGAWNLFDPIDYEYCTIKRVGKKRAGRLLDGRTWDEFPVIKEAA